MRIIKNILLTGFLVLIGGIFLLSPYLSNSKGSFNRYDGTVYPDYSSQYAFSSGDTALGGTAILNGESGGGAQAQLSSGPFFSAYLREKILSYSFLREKVLSRASLKPFSPYFIHSSSTPGRYFVLVLREIII